MVISLVDFKCFNAVLTSCSVKPVSRLSDSRLVTSCPRCKVIPSNSKSAIFAERTKCRNSLKVFGFRYHRQLPIDRGKRMKPLSHMLVNAPDTADCVGSGFAWFEFVGGRVGHVLDKQIQVKQ